MANETTVDSLGKSIATQRMYAPEDLEQRVSESVRATLGMLFPEDAWQEMIDREVKAFFETDIDQYDIVPVHETKKVVDSWNNARDEKQLVGLRMVKGVTPFRALVWHHVSAQIMGRLNAHLTGPEWKTTFDRYYENNSGELVEGALGDRVEEALERLAPRLAKDLFRGVLVNAVCEARDSIARDIKNAGGHVPGLTP